MTFIMSNARIDQKRERDVIVLAAVAAASAVATALVVVVAVGVAIVGVGRRIEEIELVLLVGAIVLRLDAWDTSPVHPQGVQGI